MIVRYYLLPLGWAIFILILILLPGENLPDTGNIWAFDKFAHAGVFAALTFLLFRSMKRHEAARGRKINAIFLTSASCILYGVLLEVGQMATPDRQFDWLDMAANTAGVCGGMAVIYFICKI